jgi:2-oxo-4-hydroxy-4-carboxy-5-ureidoimidazoline decarboxylase
MWHSDRMGRHRGGSGNYSARMPELSLDGLNGAEPELAERELLACCAARRWADELVVRRPYHDVETLQRVSDTIFAELTWADIEQGLTAHPRIGERAAGATREAAWSRAEQSAAATDHLEDQLRRGNADYEQRFGHVFLICATGLSAEAVLEALTKRLSNDEPAERAVVRDELRKIAALRLRKLVGT